MRCGGVSSTISTLALFVHTTRPRPRPRCVVLVGIILVGIRAPDEIVAAGESIKGLIGLIVIVRTRGHAGQTDSR